MDEFSVYSRQLSDIQSIDLIKPLWTEGRPAIPQDKLYPYSADFAGESVESKLARIREAVSHQHLLSEISLGHSSSAH